MLEGRTVLEWTNDVSGSFCARVLGDLGAEVIKIERPVGGDPLRRVGLVADGPRGDPTPLFGYLNHGKRSVTLDPNTPEGFRILGDLAKQADILIESEFSRHAPDGAGRIADLRAIAENLVVVSITPFGLAGGPASTPLTLQHRAGYAYHEAAPVTEPAAQPPVGCAHREGPLAAGIAAATAAMFGVLAVGRGEPAPHIDIAQFDFYATQLYPGPLSEWSEGRREFGRARAAFGGTEVAGGLVWNLQCADGWVIASPREQHQWDRWMEVLGKPAWSGDALLCGDRAVRKTNFTKLQELMTGETMKMTRAEIFQAARQGHVACLPVNTPSDLLKLEQLAARNFYDRLVGIGPHALPVPGLPFRVEGEGIELRRGREVRAPELGEATGSILGERLGIDAAALDHLHANGIV